MTLNELVALLARRWKVVVGAVAVALAAAAALSFLVGPTYQSTAEIFLGTKVKSTGNLYAAAGFGAGRAQSYAALATSQPVTSAVVRRLHLKEKPTELAKRVSATVIPETVLIDVTASDSSANGAQRLARAESQALASYISGLESKPASGVQAKIVSPAPLPNAPTSPRLLLNFVAALALGLLAGIGAAVALESLDRRRYSGFAEEDYEEFPEEIDEPTVRAEPELEVVDDEVPEDEVSQNGVSGSTPA